MAFFANGALRSLSFVNPMPLSNTAPTNNPLETDPDLMGPSLLCNVAGTVVGTFSGSGDPVTDLYAWRVYGPSGNLLFSRDRGAFQSINYPFITNGVHRIELDVSRGGIKLAKFTKQVEVIAAPQIILSSQYISCATSPLTIQAIDPSSSNFLFYKFEWKNQAGTPVSYTNNLTTSEHGVFSVSFYSENSTGEKTCEYLLTTTVSNISSINIESSSTGVCVDSEINFQTNPLVFGEWFVQKIGGSAKESLGEGSSITIRPGSDLIDFGDYEVSFKLENPSNPTCAPEGKTKFSFFPEPIFVFESAETSSGCLQSDGKLKLRALTDLDFLNIDGTGLSFGPFTAGELIEISNLTSGTYSIIGGLGPCINSLGSVVPLAIPIEALDFEIDDIIGEACTTNGKTPGSFRVTMKNGPNPNALYRVINEKGGVALNQALPDLSVFTVDIPGGKYFFEIYDDNNLCILPSQNELDIPSKDQTNFQIPETINICQSYELTPVTIQSLIFTITRPDFTTDTKNAGQSILLDQKGTYKIIGTLPSQSNICPTEKTIVVDLIDPVDFEINLIEEDCKVGSRSYEANIFSRDPTTVKFFWRDEQNELINTSQRLDLPPTSFGNYTLEVQPGNSEACPIPPKQFLAKEPVLSVDLTLVATKLCEFGPKAIIELTTTFPGEVTNVEWRRFDATGNIEILSQFGDNNYTIEVDVEGVYEAAVFARIPSLNKDCELGRRDLKLDLTPEKVAFDIPSNLSICETYSLIPTTSQNLNFEVTKPDGSLASYVSGEAIVVDQTGPYVFFAYDQVPNELLCPEIKQMEVKVNQKISFSPEYFGETCAGTKTYKAEIGTIDTTTVVFNWYDGSGAPIGNHQFLTLSTFGQFSLDVQPRGSLPCDQTPILFQAHPPLLSQSVTIPDVTLCPDAASVLLEAQTDFANVSKTEWWFTDFNGVKSQLTNELNKQSIEASLEGTYEVRIFNSVPCLLGFDFFLLMRSMDAVRPEVKENYLVCPRYEIAETINPGQFASYEWYHEGILVSTNPTYKPLLIGNFELTAFSAEGCAYQTTFITEEECELKVSFPNAIQPKNPDKQFLIYTNYLIDELEVFVFSKWGEVIFQCASSDLISEASTCPWNGTFAGKGIPPGSYAIRINYKNLGKNISKYYLGSILVIE